MVSVLSGVTRRETARDGQGITRQANAGSRLTPVVITQALPGALDIIVIKRLRKSYH